MREAIEAKKRNAAEKKANYLKRSEFGYASFLHKSRDKEQVIFFHGLFVNSYTIKSQIELNGRGLKEREWKSILLRMLYKFALSFMLLDL